ncbi:MAG: hypothetical protein U0174_24450 [Polyangiaceae bacterium]
MKYGVFLSLALTAVGAAVFVPGCSSGFGSVSPLLRIAVTLKDPSLAGTRTSRKPVSIEKPDTFPVSVEVLKADGKRDTTFNGFVRLTIKPGNVVSMSGPGVVGRNVRLKAGFADNIEVSVVGAFGDARIVAEDLGYQPTDLSATKPAQCADGIDNDGDRMIDYPADNGCQFGNDNSESGGTYEAGASQALYYQLPRVELVRGAQCTDTSPPVCTGGAATPFKSTQVQFDTGWSAEQRKFLFDMTVVRIATSGFYVTDTEGDRAPKDRRGYSSLFAFNFSAPSGMRVCDRLRSLGGTATEFFGSIQIGYPTWTLEEWDPKKRPCGVPEPKHLLGADLRTDAAKVISIPSPALVHSLVRVQTHPKDKQYVEFLYDPVTRDPVCKAGKTNCAPEGPDHDFATHEIDVHISRHFGDKKPQLNPAYDPKDSAATNAVFITDDATNCDFNGDGSVDFNTEPEKGCAKSCDADVECTEWSNFASRSNFYLSIKDTRTHGTDVKTTEVKIQADGSASPGFFPAKLRGQLIGAFSGTLGYFSGGTQYTIEARCIDDIILDPNAPPKSSAVACVYPRSEQELEPQQ